MDIVSNIPFIKLQDSSELYFNARTIASLMLTGTGIPFENKISKTAILKIFKSSEFILSNLQFLMLWSIWSSMGLIFLTQPWIISSALFLITFFVTTFLEFEKISLKSL